MEAIEKTDYDDYYEEDERDERTGRNCYVLQSILMLLVCCWPKKRKTLFLMKNPLFLGPVVKYKNGIEVVTPSIDLVM